MNLHHSHILCQGSLGMMNTCVMADYGANESAILENEILRWKVKVEIYFPKWVQVM